MTVVLDGVAVTIAAGDSDFLVTSTALLNAPLCTSKQNDPHTMVVFSAEQVGDFADLAAVVTRSPGGDESIVQSRSAHSLGVIGLAEFSARNEAIGVLVEQGHTAEEARIEIHRRATRNARTLNETAQDILDSIPEAAASTRISPLGGTGLTATGTRIPTLNPAVMRVRADKNSHHVQGRCTQQGRHSRHQPQLAHPGRTTNGGRTAAEADRERITDIWTLVGGGKLTWSYCFLSDCHGWKSACSGAGGSMRSPFRRPVRT